VSLGRLLAPAFWEPRRLRASVLAGLSRAADEWLRSRLFLAALRRGLWVLTTFGLDHRAPKQETQQW
jgi:hypothetical protein